MSNIEKLTEAINRLCDLLKPMSYPLYTFKVGDDKTIVDSDMVTIDESTPKPTWIPSELLHLSVHYMLEKKLDYSLAKQLADDIINGPYPYSSNTYDRFISYPHVYEKHKYNIGKECVERAMKTICNNPEVDKILGIKR